MKNYSQYKDITPEQIGQWKKKHGKTYTCEIDILNEDESEFIVDSQSKKVAKFEICKPSRKVIFLYHKYDGNVEKQTKVIIANCVLGGDMIYLDEKDGDDEIYIEVGATIIGLVKKRSSKLKKKIDSFLINDDSMILHEIYAIIRCHYRLDPEKLSDKKISKLYQDYIFVQKRKNDNYKNVIREVLSELLDNN